MGVARPPEADTTTRRGRENASVAPQVKGATEARARGASDEETARWSFETRDDCPGKLDIEGREMRIGTDGRRHQNIGERDERATDTTISTDGALHRAVLARGLVVMAAGGMVSLAATRARLVMGGMIVLPVRRVANVRRR